MWREASFLVGAYLLGSLPVVYLIGRLRGVDLSKVGTGNVGGGNLWLNVGPLEGLWGGVADVSKGIVPVILARYWGLGPWVAALAAMAGIAGQMWPIFLKFQGGRGNSACLGAALALTPRGLLVAAIPMVMGGAVRNASILLRPNVSLGQRLRFQGRTTRAVPLGMLLGFATLPLASWLFQEDSATIAGCLGILLLTALRRVAAGLADDRALFTNRSDFAKALFSLLLYDRSSP